MFRVICRQGVILHGLIRNKNRTTSFDSGHTPSLERGWCGRKQTKHLYRCLLAGPPDQSLSASFGTFSLGTDKHVNFGSMWAFQGRWGANAGSTADVVCSYPVSASVTVPQERPSGTGNTHFRPDIFDQKLSTLAQGQISGTRKATSLDNAGPL